MEKKPLSALLLIYVLLSTATLLLWTSKARNTVTGDEPHYLIIASGLTRHGTLEQSAPYKEEFATREIFKAGLAPEGAEFSIANTHAVSGPNGLFNVHNIGLPILLAIPYVLGGVFGAKLLMIFFGALVVAVAWKFASRFSAGSPLGFQAVLASAVAMPLLPASNQIYPEVPAGLISLVALYWFFTSRERRSGIHEILLAAAVAFLPWLQIKFAATCAVLAVSISANIFFESRDLKRALRLLAVVGASCIALAVYNHHAFGKISGPYQAGALEFSRTSLMVLLGLHFDQNQGFMFQNPLNFVGVLALGWMFKSNRKFTFVWALVFSSLIVPNALHPNWYGGLSFSGRFGWAAAVVFLVPTIYGLLEIGNRNEKALRVMIAGGMILQIYFFHQYAISGRNIYNKTAETWFDVYSTYYYPLHSWLPMLYNSDWAYGYAPNYAWSVLVFALLFMGFLSVDRLSRNVPVVAGGLASLVLLAGFFVDRRPEEIVFDAGRLPSQVRRVKSSGIFAEPEVDDLGFINKGPKFPLRAGLYEATITYKSTGSGSEPVGWVDVFNATSKTQVFQTPIYGTNEASMGVKIEFESTQWRSNWFEFRTYWNGSSNIELQTIAIRRRD